MNSVGLRVKAPDTVGRFLIDPDARSAAGGVLDFSVCTSTYYVLYLIFGFRMPFHPLYIPAGDSCEQTYRTCYPRRNRFGALWTTEVRRGRRAESRASST